MRSFGSKQRNTTGNNMCELLGESFSKKENMVWTNQGKSHVLKKKSSKKHFFDKIQGEISQFFDKNKLKKMRFSALKTPSKTESRESLTKVWRKFH